MAFPVTFATLPTGNNAASLFDTMFSTVGGMGIVECTATGTNTILLTPVANMPTIASYSVLGSFSFIAAGASTGAVTVNVNGLGALPLLNSAGSQLGSGSISSGQAVYFSTDGAGNAWIISPVAAGTSIVSVKKQAFIANGTYTPSTGMLFCLILALGAGGGGGGVNATLNNAGGGGGAGQLAIVLATAATIGASKTVTIGTAGTAGANTGGNGGNGGNTSVGTVAVGNGGSGGVGSAGGGQGAGGAGGTGGTSDIASTGATGFIGTSNNGSSGANFGGAGASSIFGGGGLGASVNAVGGNAAGFGAGGGGAASNAVARAGGTGTAGVVYILEFCSV